MASFSSPPPPDFPPSLEARLASKVAQQAFDAGAYFGVEQEETEFGHVRRAVALADIAEAECWLVDHALSFRCNDARACVTSAPGVLDRVAGIVGVDTEDCDGAEDVADRVMARLWGFVGHYWLLTARSMDETSVFYLNDEFGAAVGHDAANANVQMAPYLHIPPGGSLADAVPYTVVWTPTDADGRISTPILAGDALARDAFINLAGAEHRRWLFGVEDLADAGEYDAVAATAAKRRADTRNEWAAALDAAPFESAATAPAWGVDDGPVKVFTDMQAFHDGLSLAPKSRYVLVEDASDADVVWQFDSIFDFQTFFGDRRRFLNQFPLEERFVTKDGLGRILSEIVGESPFFPRTYALETDLADFVADFRRRQIGGSENTWIVKPANMARSLGAIVTRSLPQMLKLAESRVPHVVQKYVDRPLLLRDGGRAFKFDLRITVALRSLEPLELFVHTGCNARTANVEYSLEERVLCEFQRQLTIMDLGANHDSPNLKVCDWDAAAQAFPEPPPGCVGVKHILSDDFKKAFDLQQAGNGLCWAETWNQIHALLHEAFAAIRKAHPATHHAQSRALYGVDVILRDDGTPVLLEITWCPDQTFNQKIKQKLCERLFDLLFFDEHSDWERVRPAPKRR
ncbi:tubulin-tyrosine ligase family-domain-containing protein [Pelagophyceae sp. CCMP2097]|nr:tubulin-tyrosine ligase family-domain-containing protein [Pelagophyceae sp. CCMP2097]